MNEGANQAGSQTAGQIWRDMTLYDFLNKSIRG